MAAHLQSTIVAMESVCRQEADDLQVLSDRLDKLNESIVKRKDEITQLEKLRDGIQQVCDHATTTQLLEEAEVVERRCENLKRDLSASSTSPTLVQQAEKLEATLSESTAIAQSAAVGIRLCSDEPTDISVDGVIQRVDGKESTLSIKSETIVCINGVTMTITPAADAVAAHTAATRADRQLKDLLHGACVNSVAELREVEQRRLNLESELSRCITELQGIDERCAKRGGREFLRRSVHAYVPPSLPRDVETTVEQRQRYEEKLRQLRAVQDDDTRQRNTVNDQYMALSQQPAQMKRKQAERDLR